MSVTIKNPANRRYTIRLFALMTAYVLFLILAKWAFKRGLAEGSLAYVLALLPALPIIGVFWAVMRLLVEQTDEYLRMLMVRQCLFATGFALFITTIREWLQNFDLIAAGDHGFGAAFFWFAGLGLGALYNRITLGEGGCA
ncbi:hypothetical protein [Novosphingobium sp. MMS21-SN21R]|uniref:hypothetical protein n=1 Tax=Novosphingobium sp. MMS21-SN21R TaxID=2969298 RepID=UPI00288440FA|nr:hypothetical protein [Novosphingobium sp. MMS21-SN21R]MDT0506415.1 hypothetical protein [Novosphingobium sp. MMS21-SN21R]